MSELELWKAMIADSQHKALTVGEITKKFYEQHPEFDVSKQLSKVRRDSNLYQLSYQHHMYYRFTGKECVAGESYIINEAGVFYLYMGDDPRADPAQQIIVTRLGGGDLFFMDIKAKQEIEIKTRHCRRVGV